VELKKQNEQKERDKQKTRLLNIKNKWLVARRKGGEGIGEINKGA